MEERNKQILVGNNEIKIETGIKIWQLEFISSKIKLPGPASSQVTAVGKSRQDYPGG